MSTTFKNYPDCPRKIAFVIFDGMNILDFAGVYDPISRIQSMKYVRDLEWELCSLSFNVSDAYGLTICPDKIGGTLSGYDAIVVPGGIGVLQLMDDPEFISWLKTGMNTKFMVSSSTGSLLLGAAGFLKGHKATTHFREFTALEPLCREVSSERVVDDGTIITAGAASASLDLGLYLCLKWLGYDAMLDIKNNMFFERYDLNPIEIANQEN